jgi:hypothetical protein
MPKVTKKKKTLKKEKKKKDMLICDGKEIYSEI